MRKPRVYLILFGLLLAGGVLALFRVREREPEYGGKNLSYWVEKVAGDRLTGDFSTSEAAHALHHIGTNAVPYLLKWIPYGPPRWKTALHARVSDTFGWRGIFDPEKTHRFRRAEGAAAAFACLDGVAPETIAELSRNFVDTKNSFGINRAAAALAGCGTPGLAALVSALTNNQESVVRGAIVHGIGGMGRNAAPAVPLLVQCLRDTNQTVAAFAVTALRRLQLEPELVVPALIEGLQSTNFLFRHYVLSSLAAFGKDALPALDAIKPLLNDTNPQVRRVARATILEIDPQSLKGEGR